MKIAHCLSTPRMSSSEGLASCDNLLYSGDVATSKGPVCPEFCFFDLASLSFSVVGQEHQILSTPYHENKEEIGNLGYH